MTRIAALLPTGARMNPAAPEAAEYYDRDQTALVVTQNGAFRILTTFGTIDGDWAVGTTHEIRHDQTLRHLGSWTVIGWRRFTDGARGGDVPNRQMAHWVFK